MSAVNQVLSEIYSNVDAQKARYSDIRKKLEAQGATFKTFCHSPGRVNIISEHTDYNGYQVSPIALENDFVMAVGFKEGGKSEVHLIHMDDKTHPTNTFDYTKPKEEISRPNGQWSMYVRAGYHAAVTIDPDLPKSFGGKEIYITGCGNVALGSGLSSSSALTCCSALAFMSFSQKPIDKTAIAQQVAKSEATVAIEGGGMDQAISLCGVRGKCSVINFNPLRLDFVDLPKDVLVAVYNSLKDSKKASADNNFYNTRVAECRTGCAILYQRFQQKTDPNFKFAEHVKINMGLDIQKLYGKASPKDMLPLVEELPERLTLAEIAKELHFADHNAVIEKFFFTASGKPLLLKYDAGTTLTVRRRLRHVYSEGGRAQDFEKTLREMKADAESQKAAVAALTTYLNDSQASCRDDYECSCAELDEVIAKARECGAFCARLTGAGLGGYGVALVHAKDGKAFMEKMTAFYRGKGVADAQMADTVFLTEAGQGGGYVEFK